MKSKKVRIFIYSLVAWFVGMAVIVYDFAVSYAASFNENVGNAEWHYFTKTDGQVSNAVIDTSNYVSCDLPSDSKVSKYKYTEKLTWAYTSWNDHDYLFDFVIGSDSEIIYCYENILSESSDKALSLNGGSAVGYSSYFFVFSKTKFSVRGTGYQDLSASSQTISSKDEEDSAIWDRDSFYMFSFSCDRYSPNMCFNSYKAKVFLDVSDALNYLKTGDTSGLAWQGAAPQYDGDNIYLNDFQMIVHDSNAYSAYYLEFKYTIPEQLRDAASLQLQIEQSYEWTSCALGDSIRRPYTYTGNNYIDLLQYPTGFKLYLSDINSVQQFLDSFQLTHHQRAVLGAESIIDTSALSIGGFGGESIMRITNSKLYMTCYVIANNKFGVNYTGAVDFMTGANDMSSYTPDSSGNYKYNGDLKNQGHYYTDVATDAAGNVTYNYYYYGDDNSKTEISAKDSADNTLTVVPVPGQNGSIINNITMPDHIFVNVSGGGSSGGSSSDVGNVTIEDDDLSFNSLRDSIKDGYGLIDDTDTGAKGDGLIAMLSDLFGYLPAKFVGLIMLGTSSVVGIAVLRMIFKR